jgi:ankyrin repeat protein
MESSSKEKEKEKKSLFRRPSKKSVSLSPLNEHKEIYSEHALIIAARKKDHDAIKFHLSNRYFNPNVQNLELNTPFHEAAINCDKEAIALFLSDPRIDASIRNIKKEMARDLIDIAKVRDSMENTKISNTKYNELATFHGQLIELRRTMFARATLDVITTQECKTIKPTYQQGRITAELINETIQKIKAKIQATEKKQAVIEADETYGGNLPSSAQFPPYATDNFLMEMIFFRLSLNAINSTWLK